MWTNSSTTSLRPRLISRRTWRTYSGNTPPRQSSAPPSGSAKLLHGGGASPSLKPYVPCYLAIFHTLSSQHRIMRSTKKRRGSSASASAVEAARRCRSTRSSTRTQRARRTTTRRRRVGSRRRNSLERTRGSRSLRLRSTSLSRSR